MSLKVYAYKKCGICNKALNFLDRHHVPYELVAIRETAPSKAELMWMLERVGGKRRLFNTSGWDYRQLGLRKQLPGMTDEEAIAMLEANGNLVKRPFVVGDDIGFVGFNEGEWKDKLAL